MHNFEKQKIIALSVYLQRGKIILRFLDEGKIDSALKLLRFHRSAFYNFRAADLMCQEKNCEDELKCIALEIVNINELLENKIKKMSEELNTKISDIQREKKRLKKYQSYSTREDVFQKSI